MPDVSPIRAVNWAEFLATPQSDPVAQRLLDRTSGAEQCAVTIIRTPAGSGSPFGLHVHEFEQVFYVLEGTMTVEVAGVESSAGPGTLVVFRAGVPHRNWNASGQSTLHLSIASPAPVPGETGTRSVGAKADGEAEDG